MQRDSTITRRSLLTAAAAVAAFGLAHPGADVRCHRSRSSLSDMEMNRCAAPLSTELDQEGLTGYAEGTGL